MGVCNQCGLPEDLCVCEAIAREQQKITVKIEKRKFGKKYTVIDGIGKEAKRKGCYLGHRLRCLRQSEQG